MEKRLKIGIPKGLYYHQHRVLWEYFFTRLGCQVIFSEDTHKEILTMGTKICNSDACLPVKVFHGHVWQLKDKADYIFIPRYLSLDQNEYTCPQFCGIPDMVRLNFNGEVNILELVFNLRKNSDATYESLKKLTKTLDIPYEKGLIALMEALEAHIGEKQVLTPKSGDLHKGSVAVIGHPYMLYDHFLNMNLLKKLQHQNIQLWTPLHLDERIKRENATPFRQKPFWETGFDCLGSSLFFAKNQKLDGIIYITPFACGPDSVIMEFIERGLKECSSKPFLKLTVDEHSGEAGFDTRLEAFLDMLAGCQV